jgi:signal transduction histidine kinase/HPt (histidine-containing phosphotransfer) domain-containing protein
MIDQTASDLTSILEWLPVPAFVLGGEGTIRYVNSALASLIGGSPQRSLGRSLTDENCRVLAGEVVRSETTFSGADRGRDFTLRFIKRVARHPQWGDVIVGIGEELTGRRTPEGDETLAHLRHELQSPLSAIAGLSSLLLESPLDAGQRESLRLIQSTAETCSALLNDMLDTSKPAQGEWSLRPSEFSLREFLDGVLKPFALRADARYLRFSYSVAEEVPDRIHCDPLRLRQVLQNLAGNAIKYTEAGSVEASVTAVPDFEGRPGLQFSVRDTGIGVPKDKQSIIFQPFVQAHGSSTGRYGGTGLGLSIASRIVTLLGGRIWVESEPAVGSVFSFVIPWHAAGPRRVETGAVLDSRGFDRESALAVAGGDAQLLKELAELFLQEYPRLIADLRTAVRERDAKKLNAGAHALKGAVANFGARAAVEAALWLEARGRAGEMEGIDDGLASLERILAPLLLELGSL